MTKTVRKEIYGEPCVLGRRVTDLSAHVVAGVDSVDIGSSAAMSNSNNGMHANTISNVAS